MRLSGIGLSGLCLCLEVGVVGCADRKPLAAGEVSGAVDANTPVIDGGADRTAMADVSTAPRFVMIDDMEDHVDGQGTAPTASAFIWQPSGTERIGNWFVSTSNGSTNDAGKPLIDPPRGESHRAREIRGGDTGQADNLWAQLDHPQGRAIDLDGYAGLVFWARLTGGGGIVDVALDRLSGGGGAYFKSDFTSLPTWELFVPEQWQQFTLNFDDLPTPAAGVASIDFVVSGTAGPFDLWIDDVALLCRDTCP